MNLLLTSKPCDRYFNVQTIWNAARYITSCPAVCKHYFNTTLNAIEACSENNGSALVDKIIHQTQQLAECLVIT